MKIFAALIASLMLLNADAACPRTWQSHRRSCYFVSQNEKASWPEALRYCQAFGGNLLDIKDAEEDQYVRGLATLSGAWLLWIAANDIQEEGVWRSAITTNPITYQGPWGYNQPDQGRVGNCMALWRDSKYQWADHTCSTVTEFICKRPETANPLKSVKVLNLSGR